MISRRALLSAAVLPIACGRKHSTGFDGYAYVANEEGQAIAAVDLTAFAVVRHVRLGASPTAVAAHPKLRSIYALTPATGTVHEIDGGKLTLARKLQAGRSALAMRIPSGDPKSLYVLYREPRRLVSFSLESGAQSWQVALPEDPVDFDLSEDGATVAVSFGSGGGLGIINTTERKLGVIQTGAELGTVRFRADGRVIIAADLRERMLLLYDVDLQRLMVRLPLAVRPDQIATGGGGGQLFVTGEGQDAVVVVYPYQTPRVAQTILAGRKPGAMATSSGKPPYLFIANPSSGDVTIMNMTTMKVVAVASVGAEPGFISVTPDNQYALVLNEKSGDMGVLWIHDKLATRQKSAALLTMIPVGSRPVCAVVRQA